MSNVPKYCICRFCKSSKDADQMVQYGVRHHAHFKCYLDAGKRLDLHDWQVVGFPYKLVEERGLLEYAKAAEARERAYVNASQFCITYRSMR